MAVPNTDRFHGKVALRQSPISPLVLADPMDARVLAITGLRDWWDFHPDRVDATGANIIIKNRVALGVNLVEVAAKSNLVVGSDRLPHGGQMIAHGRFGATGVPDTILTAGAAWPIGNDAVTTKIIIFRDDETLTPSGPTRNLWRSASGTLGNHNLQYDNNRIYMRQGDTGGTVDVEARHPTGAWEYIIGSHNNDLSRLRLSVNGAAPIETTGADVAAEKVTQTGYFIGGNDATASFSGYIDTILLIYGITNAQGDLFDASRAADLLLLKSYCEARIGVLQL